MLNCKTELFPGIESQIFSGLSLLIQPLQGLLPILITKCDTIHRKHPNYEVAKLSYPAFTIRHYAGTVTCCK